MDLAQRISLIFPGGAGAWMPKRKSVHSLKRLCLENVARNVEHVWVKDCTVGSYLEGSHCCYTVGPFSVLVGSLVHELLQLLAGNQRLTSSVLHALLLPQLSELDLSSTPRLVKEFTLHIITVRCKHLSSLDLQGCDQIPTDALVNLMEGLPCLVKLDLSETQCNTHVLAVVGSCCRRLRELAIQRCNGLSPDSLLHLAYNPLAGSFCCSLLQKLNIDGLDSSMDRQHFLWDLVFVLLALPNLKILGHCFVVEAVRLIYHQQFDGARMPSGFPSLKKLAKQRLSKGRGKRSCRLTLALREICGLDEFSWPIACAVCPHLAAATVFLRATLGSGLGFRSWRHLVDLTMVCQGEISLRELLPVTASLGAQLQSLTLSGFTLEDEFSFHNLLRQCPHLQKLGVSFCSPVVHRHSGWSPNMEACLEGWDFALSPCEFPELCDLNLMHCDLEHPLPSQHATVLKQSLIDLLRHSPCLQVLALTRLPFSLDEVFQAVLVPPGTALVHLHQLLLAQDTISVHTIDLLLSSKNELDHLRLKMCSDIHETDFRKLLQRVHQEYLELDILWE